MDIEVTVIDTSNNSLLIPLNRDIRDKLEEYIRLHCVTQRFDQEVFYRKSDLDKKIQVIKTEIKEYIDSKLKDIQR
jgi:hypothetical protein